MTDAELRRAFPWIAWAEPIKIEQPGLTEPRYACRYCIAQWGLKGMGVPTLPTDPDEITTHIGLVHG